MELETHVHAKYPDSNSMNYKGLSKKMVQGLKTKGELRHEMVAIINKAKSGNIDRQAIEEFFCQNNMPGGSKAKVDAGPSQGANNPFGVARPQGLTGGPPPARKPPGSGQNRFPQPRFATGNFFNQAPAINLASPTDELLNLGIPHD